jgi:hypothetical protein
LLAASGLATPPLLFCFTSSTTGFATFGIRIGGNAFRGACRDGGRWGGNR